MTKNGDTPMGNRTALVERKTSESNVSIELNLDGSGTCDISTGVGFFDHMLHQFGYHGLFDLKIKAEGDLFVDCHHTIEDVGLALGSAFSKALDHRKGIQRMGDAFVPMDECLAFSCVDFSGRPYCVIQVDWHNQPVADIPASLMEHFWESFAYTAGCNLHIRVLYGRDNHHQAEGIFKSTGRAVMNATRVDPRREYNPPSTKGTLASRGS